MKKTLLTAVIATILLSTTLIPVMSANLSTTRKIKNEPVVLTDEVPIRFLTTLNGKVEVKEGKIPIELAEELNDSIDSFKDYFKNKFKNYWLDGELSESEKQELKNDINSLLNTIREYWPELPNIDVEQLIKLLIPAMIFFIPTVSIGYGASRIPFYGGEAFFGFMLRPIHLYYLIGYTAYLRFWPIPPRIEYADRLGMHSVSIFGFAGIYIDFGDVGIDTPTGTVLAIGATLFALGLSPDWP